jgi:hypothetical protein
MRLEKFMATGKKMGRPPGDTLYPNKEDLKDQIVVWISEGKTLRDFCRKDDSPSFRTVYDWLEADKEFDARFMRARDSGHDVIAEQALHIADNMHMGRKIVTHSGGDEDSDAMTVTEEDMLGHRKLQIETRLKLLAKWNPKKYGDKTILAGDDTAPVVIEANFDIFGELLKNLTLKRQTGE